MVAGDGTGSRLHWSAMGATTPMPGRIVHYCHDATTAGLSQDMGADWVRRGDLHPAMITGLDGDKAELAVFVGPVIVYVQSAPLEPEGWLAEGGPVGAEAAGVRFSPGTWHWPPRVP